MPAHSSYVLDFFVMVGISMDQLSKVVILLNLLECFITCTQHDNLCYCRYMLVWVHTHIPCVHHGVGMEITPEPKNKTKKDNIFGLSRNKNGTLLSRAGVKLRKKNHFALSGKLRCFRIHFNFHAARERETKLFIVH